MKRTVLGSALALAVASGLMACGGLPGIPGVPQESPMPPIFTITSQGVTPQTFSVAPGDTVTFFNTDGVEHRVTSADCPELDTAAIAANGNSAAATITQKAGTCHWSVKEKPNDSRFAGTITVAAH